MDDLRLTLFLLCARLARLGRPGLLRTRISGDFGPVHMPAWMFLKTAALSVHFSS
jgi:hypothetical protein